MMMTDEIEWGPRIERPADGWPEGRCPIPWAKAGEFKLRFGDGIEVEGDLDASRWHWGDMGDLAATIVAYRVRARLMSRLAQPAATDVVEKMAEALRAILEPTSFTWHPDGSVSVRTTKEVLEEASAVLAAYEASKETGR